MRRTNRSLPRRGRARAASARWLAGVLAAVGLVSGAAGADAGAVQIDAVSWFLQDFNTRRILAEKEPDRPVEPASLVKLMTVFVAFSELEAGNLGLEDEVTVSRKAWKMGGSQMFIEVGDRVTVEDLLKGVIVQSGNDASVALAERIAGTEGAFVHLMNENAASLGMTGTSYANSHGLPHPQNFTTARDVAILMNALISRYPEWYAWHALDSFTYAGISQPNRNRLLKRDPSVDGGKTGYTKAAGYCLAASASRDGMRLIAVVMGAPTSPKRFSGVQALLEFGYRNYITRRVFSGGEPFATARVWSGAAPSVPIGLARDLWLTLERRKVDLLDERIALEDPIIAPLPRGQPLGRIEIMLGDAKLAERDLVALAPVEAGSFFRRAMDWFWLWWE